MFDRKDAKRIATLARLELTAEELDRFAAQLGTVLDHVAALDDAVDEHGDSTPDSPRPLRADRPGHDPLNRDPRDVAPVWTEGFFSVPRLEAFGETSDPDARDE